MMLMELDDKITDFQVRTGKRPANVYLGRQEWETLMKWAYKNYGYSHGLEGKDVPEYLGCKVYRVHVENHLEVA